MMGGRSKKVEPKTWKYRHTIPHKFTYFISLSNQTLTLSTCSHMLWEKYNEDAFSILGFHSIKFTGENTIYTIAQIPNI